MIATEPKASKINRRICITLLLLVIFMVLSNLSTWEANTTTYGNLHKSVIGAAIQQGLAQATSPKDKATIMLGKDDLVSRMSIPLSATPYLSVQLIADTVASGNIDEVTMVGSGLKITGWTYVPENAGSPEFIIAVEDGKVIGALTVTEQRPDVAKALNNPKAARTGYSGQIISQSNSRGCKLTLYTLTSSLKLFAMPSVCEKADHSAQ
ncbi:hypothetical protein [Pseudomonas huanghezhanensis]|uniref:hypothetical protein n=1 Tax=Pseudomonas huanghezhanensis TaxID=3002903 RepID=UPI0022863471|nr:hypothetical protein [Pseudomonas sp. BSw22131]